MTRGGPHQGGTNLHCEEMDRLLEKAPPVIKWVKNKHGVMVHVEINDPRTENRKRGRAKKAEAPKKARPLTAAAYKAALAAHALELREARERRLESMQTEADEVAERFRKHHAENTQLLNAARRPI